ncbi:MAG: hypothetical protein KGJ23_01800 [Euryarchaeota archaeon]|nr:hypothetical protein [Euryarchaeota archaeon]MDE1835329.1 hypothetical protein [Euryarchaeota archaeon]MDE1880776.1 hypothetical protein [Euryarchaeota archaeon]MDE2043625.1 hypothetical protein [Thermoplasmata archaeon]
MGPIRMRALLATSSLVRLSVRYANRGGKHPLMTCPVCFHPIRPRYNETLWGDSSVIVGYRCTACPFWTPRQRRMPAQYTFRSTFHDEAAPASAT